MVQSRVQCHQHLRRHQHNDYHEFIMTSKNDDHQLNFVTSSPKLLPRIPHVLPALSRPLDYATPKAVGPFQDELGFRCCGRSIGFLHQATNPQHSWMILAQKCCEHISLRRI